MLARTGDAYSLDRWLFGRGRPAPEPSGEYRWPVRATWLLMSLVFCSAGFAKLRNVGLAWVFSDNMATKLLQHGYNVASHEPLSDIGPWLAQYLSRRARWIFPPAMCGLLIGIRLFMGPTFPQFVICHLFWVRWDRVAAAVSNRVQRRLVPA